ncbi:MAG: hypothetical protein QXF12_04615 [Candidatus Aenigmatarchaeota archaeon]
MLNAKEFIIQKAREDVQEMYKDKFVTYGSILCVPNFLLQSYSDEISTYIEEMGNIEELEVIYKNHADKFLKEFFHEHIKPNCERLGIYIVLSKISDNAYIADIDRMALISNGYELEKNIKNRLIVFRKENKETLYFYRNINRYWQEISENEANHIMQEINDKEREFFYVEDTSYIIYEKIITNLCKNKIRNIIENIKMQDGYRLELPSVDIKEAETILAILGIENNGVYNQLLSIEQVLEDIQKCLEEDIMNFVNYFNKKCVEYKARLVKESEMVRYLYVVHV